jgi:hypothetical protein
MNAERARHRRTVEWTRFVKAFGTHGAESLAVEGYEDCCRRSNFYQNFYQNRVYGADPPGRIRRTGHAESQVRQQMRDTATDPATRSG